MVSNPVFPTTTNKASAKAEAFGFYKRAIQAPLEIASEKKPKPRTFAKQMDSFVVIIPHPGCRNVVTAILLIKTL